MLMRLDKYLCSCGTGTRTEVKKIIKSKRVKVNNKIIDTSDFKVDETMTVTLGRFYHINAFRDRK